MRSFGGRSLGGFALVISRLFFLILSLNLMGLVPYVFRVTSHLAISFTLGFPLWFILIYSGFWGDFVSGVAQLLPAGAPSILNPFLVLVETLSICVRSITLSVRLVANICAGHIILGLVGTYLRAGLFSWSWLSVGLLAGVQVFYSMFEVGICLIQAYIFCLLIILYSDEHTADRFGYRSSHGVRTKNYRQWKISHFSEEYSVYPQKSCPKRR